MSSDHPVTEFIRVRGARVHNLANVDVDLPRDQLVVISGPSGSGKSSLAFDTLFAEGQRRYLESLSTWTRQFLHQLERPDVDLITGLPPTISVQQRSGSTNVRSTLATLTEIHDYLRLLYSRAGTAHCPDCGRIVARQSVRAIVDQIRNLDDRRKVMILAPLVRGRRGIHRDVFEHLVRDGFVRARVDGDVIDVSDPPELAKTKLHSIEAVVDRIIVKPGIEDRLRESVETALRHGDGTCLVSHQVNDVWFDQIFSTIFACADCAKSFLPLEPRSFSFNSPYGACAECDGMGTVAANQNDLDGDETDTQCPACHGARLAPFPRHVTVDGKPLHQLVALEVAEALGFAEGLADRLSPSTTAAESPFLPDQALVARGLLPEIMHRLRYLLEVGLSYLTLDRPANTLSGGEFQRARLASCLGSGLTGVCYILDEPTIGLHPRDTTRLMATLERLRDQGNSIVLVEHDPDVIRRADYIIDLGPGAGQEGGRIVASGVPQAIQEAPESVSGPYLTARNRQPSDLRIAVDPTRCLSLRGVRTHNLRNIDVDLPLGVLVCLTGVSGSGKSSLLAHTLVPWVKHYLATTPLRATVPAKRTKDTAAEADSAANPAPATFERFKAQCDAITGCEHLSRILEVDQSPIGRTGRSNPATYSKVWDEIRKLFAKTRQSRVRGFTAKRFSFNSTDGRCSECRGHGVRRIEMKFLPDLFVTCASCRGARFNRQTLSIRFGGRNVADVLAMRIDEAAELFQDVASVHQVLATFVDVGLGYLQLGQSSLSLSGGEAQRVKLAGELAKVSHGHTLFVLDEPTTGLHPVDIEKLMIVLRGLVRRGHSVVVVEHNLDLIVAADWIIDLGPEAGTGGGDVVFTGTVDDFARARTSHTARALADTIPFTGSSFE